MKKTAFLLATVMCFFALFTSCGKAPAQAPSETNETPIETNKEIVYLKKLPSDEVVLYREELIRVPYELVICSSAREKYTFYVTRSDLSEEDRTYAKLILEIPEHLKDRKYRLSEHKSGTSNKSHDCAIWLEFFEEYGGRNTFVFAADLSTSDKEVWGRLKLEGIVIIETTTPRETTAVPEINVAEVKSIANQIMGKHLVQYDEPPSDEKILWHYSIPESPFDFVVCSSESEKYSLYLTDIDDPDCPYSKLVLEFPEDIECEDYEIVNGSEEVYIPRIKRDEPGVRGKVINTDGTVQLDIVVKFTEGTERYFDIFRAYFFDDELCGKFIRLRT